MSNNSNFFIHYRLTKYCNADCSYCSSYNNSNPNDYISEETFSNSLAWIRKYWDSKSLSPEFVGVNYVGGEVLTIPTDHLSNLAEKARAEFSSNDSYFSDGCQSNLIASGKKVEELNKIFDGRIGTSIDNFTGQRTFKGSSERYNKVFWARSEDLKNSTGMLPGGIVVVDSKNKDSITKEIDISARLNRPLTLRPVFEGGCTVDNDISNEDLNEYFISYFDHFFLRKAIKIEPFFSQIRRLLISRFQAEGIGDDTNGCNFYDKCTSRSLNIEPNGDVYTCVELADMDKYKLGNVNDDTFTVGHSPVDGINNISNDCKVCEHFEYCRGGCTAQKLDSFGLLNERSPLCATWTHLYERVVEEYEANPEKLLHWARVLWNKR